MEMIELRLLPFVQAVELGIELRPGANLQSPLGDCLYLGRIGEWVDVKRGDKLESINQKNLQVKMLQYSSQMNSNE